MLSAPTSGWIGPLVACPAGASERLDAATVVVTPRGTERPRNPAPTRARLGSAIQRRSRLLMCTSGGSGWAGPGSVSPRLPHGRRFGADGVDLTQGASGTSWGVGPPVPPCTGETSPAW